jgi:hypothetical protein
MRAEKDKPNAVPMPAARIKPSQHITGVGYQIDRKENCDYVTKICEFEPPRKRSHFGRPQARETSVDDERFFIIAREIIGYISTIR